METKGTNKQGKGKADKMAALEGSLIKTLSCLQVAEAFIENYPAVNHSFLEWLEEVRGVDFLTADELAGAKAYFKRS